MRDIGRGWGKKGKQVKRNTSYRLAFMEILSSCRALDNGRDTMCCYCAKQIGHFVNSVETMAAATLAVSLCCCYVEGVL